MRSSRRMRQVLLNRKRDVDPFAYTEEGGEMTLGEVRLNEMRLGEMRSGEVKLCEMRLGEVK